MLKALTPEIASWHPAQGEWCVNECIGHIIEALQQTGLDATHVPYRGTGPMITDLLAGQTHMTFTGSGPLMPHVTAGKLRALAVGTASRTPA